MSSSASAVTLAILSDLHIDSTRDDASLARALAAFDAAREEGADHVVVCGDLFDHSRAVQLDGRVLKQELERQGWWTPERLSIAVGNHDLSPFGHHSSVAQLARGVVLPRLGRARTAFSAWAGELALLSGRLHEQKPYPHVKEIRHVSLWVLDTTSLTLRRSASGFFPEADARAIRERLAASPAGRRHVFALHHPPYAEPPLRVRPVVGRGMRGLLPGRSRRRHLIESWFALARPRGFVPADMARLRCLLESQGIDAILCGHVHIGLERSWKIGATSVFLEGRTGGVHGESAITVLTLPACGEPSWRTRWL